MHFTEIMLAVGTFMQLAASRLLLDAFLSDPDLVDLKKMKKENIKNLLLFVIYKE